MSDNEKTLALLAALVGVRTSGPRKVQRPRMADEIGRLRDENAALRAAVERVLALHEVFGDWCDRCDCVAPCATLRALEVGP